MSSIRKRVWLGWDDGRLFSSLDEDAGLHQADVPQDLLDAWSEVWAKLYDVEHEIWSYTDKEKR